MEMDVVHMYEKEDVVRVSDIHTYGWIGWKI